MIYHHLYGSIRVKNTLFEKPLKYFLIMFVNCLVFREFLRSYLKTFSWVDFVEKLFLIFTIELGKMHCSTLLFMYTKSLRPIITITLNGLKDTLIISKAVKCNLLTLRLVRNRTIINYD